VPQEEPQSDRAKNYPDQVVADAEQDPLSQVLVHTDTEILIHTVHDLLERETKHVRFGSHSWRRTTRTGIRDFCGSGQTKWTPWTDNFQIG
jgi:hypothetical protein